MYTIYIERGLGIPFRMYTMEIDLHQRQQNFIEQFSSSLKVKCNFGPFLLLLLFLVPLLESAWCRWRWRRWQTGSAVRSIYPSNVNNLKEGQLERRGGERVRRTYRESCFHLWVYVCMCLRAFIVRLQRTFRSQAVTFTGPSSSSSSTSPIVVVVYVAVVVTVCRICEWNPFIRSVANVFPSPRVPLRGSFLLALLVLRWPFLHFNGYFSSLHMKHPKGLKLVEILVSNQQDAIIIRNSNCVNFWRKKHE